MWRQCPALPYLLKLSFRRTHTSTQEKRIVAPREFLVDADEAGARLETFLRKHLGLARPVALKALRKGWVRVDGRRARADRRLEVGERVRITNYALPIPALEGAPEPSGPALPASEVARAGASVRYQDEAVVVSAKPAGAVVHRGSGHPYGWIDLLAAALGGGNLVPVGRLDRDTSGLLVLARGRGPARRLFEALRAGRLERTYTALAAGRVKRDAGRIDLPLEKGGAAGRQRMAPRPSGRAAATRYRVVRRLREATLLEVRLETGRTHQIRAHLAAIGHPLLGDPRYGDAAAQRVARRAGSPRLFLHAGEVRFAHPEDDREVTFAEPLPPELAGALAALE